MKKVLLPIMAVVTILFAACGGNNGDKTISSLFNDEDINNHMPKAEARKYSKAEESLADIDVMAKNYMANKTQERFESLAEMCSELNYEFDASEMDAEGRRDCMLLQAQVDSARKAVEDLLVVDFATMRFPCISENDLLIESARTWPIYLQKGTKLHYNMGTNGNVTMKLINADARKILKTYIGKKQIRDSVTIPNSAIYLWELTPKGTAYIDLTVTKQISNVSQLRDGEKKILVDTVECSAADFMAVKVQGIEMNSIYREPKKATLRSVGKSLFGGSSRAVIPIAVPKGCTDLLYSLRISTNEGDKSSDGKFDKRMKTKYKKIRFLGIPLYDRTTNRSNLFRELLYSDTPVREEEAYCNVYVFTNQAEAKKFQDGKNPSELKYNIDLSLMGTQSCNGQIHVKGFSNLYLGFDNERFRYSNYLWLEVLAVSPKNEYYRVKYKVE